MRDLFTSPRAIEIKRGRRIKKIRLAIFFSVFFIVIIGALSFFSGDKRVVIDKVIVSGNQIIDKKDIEDIVYKNISGKYIYLFSKANSFIYPHEKIYDDLILNFPRIEKLSIDRDNLKTINIDIIERTGSYLYCGVSIPEDKNEVGENCYFMNNNGYIFDKAPYFSGNVYFKYYMMIDGVENPLGRQMLDINEFHKLARFIDGVTALGFNPTHIYKDKNNTNYLYLNHTESGTTPEIMFKNDHDLELIGENLSIAMRKKEFADEINSKYNTLLYIDLRFENKVLYKFQ